MGARRLIRLDVARELAKDFVRQQHLIPGHVVYRESGPDYPGVYVYWIDNPDAPAGAAQMKPWFTHHDDGTVTLRTVDYYDGTGQLIPADTSSSHGAQ